MRKIILILIILSFACPTYSKTLEIDNLPFMRDIQKRHNDLWDQVEKDMSGITLQKSVIEVEYKNEVIDQKTYTKRMADLRGIYLKHKEKWKEINDAIDRDGTRILREHGYKVNDKPTSDLPSFE